MDAGFSDPRHDAAVKHSVFLLFPLPEVRS